MNCVILDNYDSFTFNLAQMVGLQFHPESIGTSHGRDLVAAFLLNDI